MHYTVASLSSQISKQGISLGILIFTLLYRLASSLFIPQILGVKPYIKTTFYIVIVLHKLFQNSALSYRCKVCRFEPKEPKEIQSHHQRPLQFKPLLSFEEFIFWPLSKLQVATIGLVFFGAICWIRPAFSGTYLKS